MASEITFSSSIKQLLFIALLMLPLSSIADPSGADLPSVAVGADHGDVPLISVGMIQEIDLENSSVVVNGQTIVVDMATELQTSDAIHFGYLSLGQLEQRDYVAIFGELIEPGLSLATIISLESSEYTQGASPAYIKAIVSDSDFTSATATSGSTFIDFSASLHSTDNTAISDGDTVEFFGTAIDSLLSATYIRNSSNQAGSAAQAIRGSGVRAIRGSGVRAIRGSGVRAIRGSGVRAIRGSGVRAIRGSGVRAIRGSGVRAIRGSGVRAIRGSGVRAIRGSGVRAIRGSGVRAIRGSGVRAIRGSGVRAIRGSGVRAIRGSGVRAIRGSGVRAIRGSGVRAIRGSGVR